MPFILIFLSLNFGLVEDNSFTIFPYKNKFYKIDFKEVSYLDQGIWKTYLNHNFDLKSFKFDFIENDEILYLISSGGGKVIEFKNNNLQIIDNSQEWDSRYESDYFIKNDTIFSFGGYGYFNFKNDLLYFDKTIGEWFLYDRLSQVDKRSKHVGYFNSSLDKYFIGFGINHEGNLKDFISYNFENNKIEEIGSLNINIENYFIVKNFGIPLIITKK